MIESIILSACTGITDRRIAMGLELLHLRLVRSRGSRKVLRKNQVILYGQDADWYGYWSVRLSMFWITRVEAWLQILFQRKA